MEKFLKDRLAELHSVSWPTKRQATEAMITVLVIMLLVGVALTVTDYLLNEGVLYFLEK